MTSECLIQNDYYFSQCKSVFDELEGTEMRKARTHSNPFELIKGVFFQNRAAMKMANMDAIFDFMFTSPKDRKGASMIKVMKLGIWFLIYTHSSAGCPPLYVAVVDICKFVMILY